jgi:small subunit ribosomal protein S11
VAKKVLAAVKGNMSFYAVNRTAYSRCFYSHPRVGNLTTRPAESLSLSFNPPWFPLQKLVGVCVNRESFGGTGLGFQGKAKKDLMVVLRVSPQEPIRAQGNKRATLDFKHLCRDGKVESALEALGELEKNGVLVDSLDLVKLLQVCEARKLVGAAKRVLDYATRSLSGTVVFNKLVRVYCKWGDTRSARSVFEEMPMRDLDSWNRMLIGLAENGEGEEALEVFSRMKKEGVKPDGSTFLGIIMACGCLGKVLNGQKHFMSMSRDYGITPSMEHYVAIVDLLGRAGKKVEAKEFIANMPIEPSSVVRETLQKHFPTDSTETKGKQLGKQKLPSRSEHKSRRKGKGKRIKMGRKAAPCKIPQGVIHVSATFNNTFVTVTDLRGKVFSWSSAGLCGFKNTRRGTPFAAETAAGDAIKWAMKQGLWRAEVTIKGAGLGRDAALRAIRRSGIILSFIRDVTPLPHNGCRPPKKRRV